MEFPTIQLDLDRLSRTQMLFPDGIESDEWMLFHGTSGYNAGTIERHGLGSDAIAVSTDEIERVVGIFEVMNWAGNDGGGLAVLKPFSLDHDFQVRGQSPLYLAEASIRALTFATRDFAGGEKLRALRRAFKDLESYLANPDVRRRHWEYQQRCFAIYSDYENLPPDIEATRPRRVDLEWLNEELTGLTEIRQRADDAFHQYDHGMVYALRMTKEDIGCLIAHPTMGIKANATIPATRIAGRVFIPLEVEVDSHLAAPRDTFRRLRRGLLAALSNGATQ